MNNAVLTDRQSACRAAHEQAELLQHLYDDLFGDAGGDRCAAFQLDRRLQELRTASRLLAGKLSQLGLLRTQPDPEREGLLEVLTGLKQAFGAGDERAASDRLLAEEQEFLKLNEQLAEHDEDDALAATIKDTRAAIARLEELSAGPG